MTPDGGADAVVHVVRAPHRVLGADDLAVLAPPERARAAAHRREDDRRRTATAALLLRAAAGALTGRSPADVEVVRRCTTCGGDDHGRPELPGTGWHASVSHAGAWCVVALTRAGPVGVDLEELVPLDVARVAPVVLAPGERARDAAQLLRLWVRKEAAVKATGAGLRTPLDTVRVASADAPAALLACPGVPAGTGVLRDVDAPPGYVAAVCVLPASAATGAAVVVRALAAATPAAAAQALGRSAGVGPTSALRAPAPPPVADHPAGR